MARKINRDVLDERIEKAQEDVVKAKKKYDASTATLKQLLDKRQAMLLIFKLFDVLFFKLNTTVFEACNTNCRIYGVVCSA